MSQQPGHYSSSLSLFEDDHLLVVNKPAGLNTHSPSPFAGEGLYEWLRHREPRWSSLAIMHRLDKETSGIILFAKSTLANRSLTQQFTDRSVVKQYQFLTDRTLSRRELSVESALVRAGEKYVSRPKHPGGEHALTHFRLLNSSGGRSLVQAQPMTGRTHQIRVHAAEAGFPILGDVLYGGSDAPRLCLHAARMECRHPASGNRIVFEAAVDFSADAHGQLREALVASAATNVYRLIHGGSDRWPGWYVDRLGDFLLSQAEQPLTLQQQHHLESHFVSLPIAGAYHKRLQRQVRRIAATEHTTQKILGADAPDRFTVKENGLNFELRFGEGYSVGLFLDQRENRRRILVNHVAAGFPLFAAGSEAQVLNAFAYTCGFSVCAALGGARVTSIDLSPKYLDWGKRHFELNGLQSREHEFLTGDVFDWLRRLTRKQRQFDLVILDPPTFSTSKISGLFQAEKHFARLVAAALPAIKAGGVLFCSCNAARLEPAAWLRQIETAIGKARREILRQHYVPQPVDFPISRAEPGYLKTVWMRLG